MKDTNNILDTFDIISAIDARTHERHGITSRPNGQLYALLILEIAHEVIMEVSPKALTDELFDYMTDNNYHTARQACELAIDLLRKEGAKV